MFFGLLAQFVKFIKYVFEKIYIFDRIDSNIGYIYIFDRTDRIDRVIKYIYLRIL